MRKTRRTEPRQRRDRVNLILQPLSAGFRLGVALRHAAYHRGWLKVRKLDRPVVSVGNLTVGGTGKTPLVALIAGILLKRGLNPAILTRGYGRRRGPGLVAIPPGSARVADPSKVGDEPALLASELPQVPLVICANRFRAGRTAEKRFQADVHILDDGFQHLAIARDVDIVVLDVTQEISRRVLLPAGRFREPTSALKRAHLIVLTRSELGDADAWEDLARRTHPEAEVFRCTTVVSRFTDRGSGQAFTLEQLNDSPVSAFCGIGNPRAFFADLRSWGFTVVREDAFPDHHVYTKTEMQGLVEKAILAGASALITTRKDAVKIPPDLKLEKSVFICDIRAEVQDAAAFESALLSRLEAANRAG
jgi:tetraacyldisaccharide 4'-kinase